jgi:hypothetical protein
VAYLATEHQLSTSPVCAVMALSRTYYRPRVYHAKRD